MDDIICFFSSESDADKFFVFLNQRHSNIKFTIEKESHNQLSCVDLLITTQPANIGSQDAHIPRTSPSNIPRTSTKDLDVLK